MTCTLPIRSDVGAADGRPPGPTHVRAAPTRLGTQSTRGPAVAERSAEDIQRDIEKSRAALASAVDQLAYRTNPKRVTENAKQSIRAKVQSPQGQAVLAVVGGLLAVVIIRRIRKH